MTFRGSGGADALSAAGSGGATAQHRQDQRGGTGFAAAGAGVRQLEQHPSGRWRALKLERGRIALKRKAPAVAWPSQLPILLLLRKPEPLSVVVAVHMTALYRNLQIASMAVLPKKQNAQAKLERLGFHTTTR